MATLKVKNRSRNKIELRLDDGRGRIEIPPDGTADLDEAALRSKSFAASFEHGVLEFAGNARPGEEERALAKRVMPGLIDGLAARIRGMRAINEKTVEQLKKLREDYNRAWDGAHDLLNRAKGAATAGQVIADAANRYLKPAAGEEVIKKIRAELQELDKADVRAEGFDLAAWYRRRQAKEEELRRAEAALANDRKAADNFAAQYHAKLEALTAEAERLKQQADTAIGRKVDW